MNFPSDMEVFRWKPAACLQVSGSDAAGFLQGQFTNDLRDLGSSSRYGLWLNVKGKVLADSFVFSGATADEFWLCSYASPAAIIRERLESHIIADDVTINDQSARWSALTVFGKDARDRVDAVLEKGEPGFVFPGRRGGIEHVEWLLPATAVDAACSRLSPGSLVDADEVARRRMAAGIPLVPVDLGPGDLPNEGGLEEVAISSTKGCYLGQEVMARLKSMGRVRRRLLRVRGLLMDPLTPPAPLFAGARQVGELRSFAPQPTGGMIGLAMLSLLHVQPGRLLALAAEGPGVIELVDAP